MVLDITFSGRGNLLMHPIVFYHKRKMVIISVSRSVSNLVGISIFLSTLHTSVSARLIQDYTKSCLLMNTVHHMQRPKKLVLKTKNYFETFSTMYFYI